MQPQTENAPVDNQAQNLPPVPRAHGKPARTKGGKSLQKYIKLVIITVVVLAAAGTGAWYALNNFVGWPYKTMTVENKKYSIRFGEDSKQIEIEGIPFLQGKELNGANVINVGFQAVNFPSDCSAFSTAKFKVKVGKIEYPVCNEEGPLQHVYFCNFELDGSWYAAQILSEDRKTKPDEATVKKIISSIKIKDA